MEKNQMGKMVLNPKFDSESFQRPKSCNIRDIATVYNL